jgi:hypothetical protein
VAPHPVCAETHQILSVEPFRPLPAVVSSRRSADTPQILAHHSQLNTARKRNNCACLGSGSLTWWHQALIRNRRVHAHSPPGGPCLLPYCMYTDRVAIHVSGKGDRTRQVRNCTLQWCGVWWCGGLLADLLPKSSVFGCPSDPA